MAVQKETIAIVNGDDTSPVLLTIVVSTDNSSINGLVALNPDGTNIGS